MSFRISSDASDGTLSLVKSAGLSVVTIIVRSDRNSTRTLTPAFAAALKRRSASDWVNFARPRDIELGASLYGPIDRLPLP
jgi:hypothetical protein